MIRIEALSKTYRTRAGAFPALCDISLDVQPGEVLGIIGESGAGKSSLMRCINLLERPDSGSIFIDNTNLAELSDADLRAARRKIGVIFQHFNLISAKTVFDNVALPLLLCGVPSETRAKRVSELLDLVGLADKAQQYPAALSGGQKQRVAIARALANNPRVLLCDEATSALDPGHTASILKLLRKINREMKLSIILITHEMDVVKQLCDRVAILQNGRVVETGTVVDIFAHPKADATRHLVEQALHLDLPQSYQASLRATPGDADRYPVMQLNFTHETANKPVMAELIRDFSIELNILQGKIEHINDQNFGVLIVEMRGKDKNITRACEFLSKHNIEQRCLGYVARTA